MQVPSTLAVMLWLLTSRRLSGSEAGVVYAARPLAAAAGLALLTASVAVAGTLRLAEVNGANSALVSATWATGTIFTSFAPFTSANLNVPTAASVSGGTGLISNIGWTPSSPTGPFSVSTNVFLGTVVFHVKTDLPQVVQTGFFDANFAVALDASLALITPDFTSFTTNPVMASRVPSLGAPGMALLWALLALVGWWTLRGQQQRRCL